MAQELLFVNLSNHKKWWTPHNNLPLQRCCSLTEVSFTFKKIDNNFSRFTSSSFHLFWPPKICPKPNTPHAKPWALLHRLQELSGIHSESRDVKFSCCLPFVSLFVSFFCFSFILFWVIWFYSSSFTFSFALGGCLLIFLNGFGFECKVLDHGAVFSNWDHGKCSGVWCQDSPTISFERRTNLQERATTLIQNLSVLPSLCFFD